jgi:hypothetical protein
VSETGKLLDAWLPPENAGAAIACLATSFTFEPEFFEGDCLARFLSLDTVRNESPELSFLIEQEERLGETRAAVVVDRSYRAQGRSLRWDILAVGLRGGVQHAKVALLLWENALRIIVGSANLTATAYRRNVETGIVLDAISGCGVPKEVFAGLLDALRTLVDRTEGRSDESGPKQRALETLELAVARVNSLDLARVSRRRGLRMAVVPVSPGAEALPHVRRVWVGSPPDRASVMSPFFDGESDRSIATNNLLKELRRRGHVRSTFVVSVDQIEGKTFVRAPRAILAHQSHRVSIDFRSFAQPGEGEPRRLHGKAIVLESHEWIAALVGSCNFTAAGLGLLPGAGNLEVNLAFGAPKRSPEAKTLRQVISAGELLDPDLAEWEPEHDDEELQEAVLPLGFAECLLDPPPSPAVILRFRPSELSGRWTVSLPPPIGRALVSQGAWARAGRREEMRFLLADGEHPFLLRVEWPGGEVDWPLNVTDPTRLPPPEQLRDLPAEALIQALSSTRPLHEALATALERGSVTHRIPVELDPLKRYSSTGHLFHRTRRISVALAALRRRLERPAASTDVLEWRLRGPFGPRTLAEGLLREEVGETRIQGEAAFFIAELALTLSLVDWSKASAFISHDEVRTVVRGELRHLRKLARTAPVADERLRAYIRRALREARV